ncbi:hypothetical protein ACOQFV_27290 [Nocardiopsis changdeensis]|uniref:Phage tail protein n=1 Tax=Nocardiopsis changdeensis TaxID=2831969 RepID=A0ABX8BRH5_9ACTN|nr:MULTISPECIES: hypothetical protein [Nocardiopsis]QUX22973.1 hypothetical protein KGD84_00750 [Nocardiopsis changdeensis]QYX38916.1 hypothetical protein K1J57_10200 [Nocardiopsis sp. MT53]
MLPDSLAWQGLTLGPPSVYQLLRLDGWEDMPPLDSGDEPRPARHGSWAGTSYAQARTVTVTGRIRALPVDIRDRVRDLRRVCAVPDDDTLWPLVATVLGESLTVDARVSLRVISLDKYSRLGHVPFTLQWTCPDPIRYDPDPVHLAIVPGAARPAPQQGTTSSRPTITIYGPCTTPTITVTRPGRPPLSVGFAVTMFAGESLTLDCHAGTVTASWGDDITGTLTAGSVPVEALAIPVGTSTVALAATGTGATTRAHVTYRHAYL